MTVEPTWQLALALVLLVALAVGASVVGRLGQERETVVAALRAVAQLAVVSTIIVACLQHLALAALFVLVMFAVAVRTTVKRTGVGRAWPWTALAMATGIVPVLVIVFASGAVPASAVSLIPIAGIVVGNMMTAHTLFGRRQFAALRDDIGSYEAALALGFQRPAAVRLVGQPTAREALVPNLDQTRTVGLVTLPGAFIGVLLGGGSALQAGAAQVLVLVAIMAGQSVVVVVANWLMCRGKLLPPDLVQALHP